MIKEALKGFEELQKPTIVKPTTVKPTTVRNIELIGGVKNSGTFEIPPDATINQIIYSFGGGIHLSKKVKAVLFGGETGICLSYVDFGLTLENALKKVGFSGKLDKVAIVLEGVNIVELSRKSINTKIRGLCGKCIPCREGTKRVQEVLDKIIEGYGKEEDIELLSELVDTIAYTSLCRLGKVSINTVESSLKYFREEYVSMIKGKESQFHTSRIKNMKEEKDCLLNQAQIA